MNSEMQMQMNDISQANSTIKIKHQNMNTYKKKGRRFLSTDIQFRYNVV